MTQNLNWRDTKQLESEKHLIDFRFSFLYASMVKRGKLAVPGCSSFERTDSDEFDLARGRKRRLGWRLITWVSSASLQVCFRCSEKKTIKTVFAGERWRQRCASHKAPRPPLGLKNVYSAGEIKFKKLGSNSGWVCAIVDCPAREIKLPFHVKKDIFVNVCRTFSKFLAHIYFSVSFQRFRKTKQSKKRSENSESRIMHFENCRFLYLEKTHNFLSRKLVKN